MKFLHYMHYSWKKHETACGAKAPLEEVCICPRDIYILCNRCKKSEVYKEKQLMFELVYDGDEGRWCSDWHQGILR